MQRPTVRASGGRSSADSRYDERNAPPSVHCRLGDLPPAPHGELVLLAFRPWKHAVWEHGRYFLMVRVAPGGSSSSAGMNIRVGWPYENEGDGDEPRPSGPRHISVGDWSGGSHELLGIHCAKYGTVTTTWLTPHRYRKEGTAVWNVSWYYLPASGFLAVLPVAWALVNRKRFGRRRPLAGSCDHCGYDLRASRDRCPECGRAIPAKVSV